MKTFENIAYGELDAAQMLDIYLPDGEASSAGGYLTMMLCFDKRYLESTVSDFKTTKKNPT